MLSLGQFLTQLYESSKSLVSEVPRSFMHRLLPKGTTTYLKGDDYLKATRDDDYSIQLRKNKTKAAKEVEVNRPEAEPDDYKIHHTIANRNAERID